MSGGLLGIALSGLRAAQTGLATTGHNIANVNTTGYSRQQTIQTASRATLSGSGYVGTGVDVTTVRRVYSEYATQSLRDSSAASAQADAYANEIKKIDGWLTDSSSNLSSAVDGFFSTVQTVATNPADSAARQTMLSSARTLSARFNGLSDRLAQQGGDIDREIDDNVSTVNALAQQIASLNRRIQTDDANSNISQAPNDLLDQRDQLVQQIAGTAGATAIPQSDGSVNLFLGNGQPLVVGSQANALSSVADDQDPSRKQLALNVSGHAVRVSTVQLGGTLGGLMSFRDDVLTQAGNTLGQIAIALGSALNAQNRLGQDGNGNPGAALFTVASPVVTTAASNSPGSGVDVTIANASALTAADYRLSYDGTNYSVLNTTTHTSQTFASLPATVDGMQIALSGPLAAGDHFTLSPTRNGASGFAVTTTDPSMIAAAAPVAMTRATGNTGTATMTSLAVLPADPLPANLRTPIDVRFHVASGTTTYDLVDHDSGTVLSAGNAYSDGAAISSNGWSLTLTGVPADHDTMTVGPNVGGAGDNRNALLLAAVQQKAVTPSGSAGDAYGGLVGTIGNLTNEATAQSDAAQSLMTQAQEGHDAVSGVNLDEEAANLQKYQQAYQAASKSIAAANAMFDAVMALFH